MLWTIDDLHLRKVFTQPAHHRIRVCIHNNIVNLRDGEERLVAAICYPYSDLPDAELRRRVAAMADAPRHAPGLQPALILVIGFYPRFVFGATTDAVVSLVETAFHTDITAMR